MDGVVTEAFWWRVTVRPFTPEELPSGLRGRVILEAEDVMTNQRDDNPEQDFADAKPLPGLEHLGRAIVDANGVPSGSPANYEYLRGKGEPSISDEERDRILADLTTEFPREEGEEPKKARR